MGPLLLSATEPSADRLASVVGGELGARRPELSWEGIGGPELRGSTCFKALGRAEDMSGAGLVELLPQLAGLYRGRRTLQKALLRTPQFALFVDAPDLHLPLAKQARGLGVPVIQLGLPQF